MAERFIVYVCPICERQVSEDPEMGESCMHPRFGYVEAVKLEVEVPSNLSAVAGLARFRLSEEQRERDFSLAEQRWFDGLPESERERIRQERYRKLPHHLRKMAEFDNVMSDNMRRMLALTEPLSGATSEQREAGSDS
jgi:hypothetical protein